MSEKLKFVAFLFGFFFRSSQTHKCARIIYAGNKIKPKIEKKTKLKKKENLMKKKKTIFNPNLAEE